LTKFAASAILSPTWFRCGLESCGGNFANRTNDKKTRTIHIAAYVKAWEGSGRFFRSSHSRFQISGPVKLEDCE